MAPYRSGWIKQWAEAISILWFIFGIPLIPIGPMVWQACFHNIWTDQIDEIRPGMTKLELIRRFGAPRLDSKINYWVYDRDFMELIFIFFNEDGTVHDHTI